jgi:hypothetical protein
MATLNIKTIRDSFIEFVAKDKTFAECDEISEKSYGFLLTKGNQNFQVIILESDEISDNLSATRRVRKD